MTRITDDDARLGRDIRTFIAFEDASTDAYDQLFGRKWSRNALRERILRLAALAGTEHRGLLVSEIQALCGRYASKPAVRTEIDRLILRRLLRAEPHPRDRRATIIYACERTMRFFREMHPLVRIALAPITDPE